MYLNYKFLLAIVNYSETMGKLHKEIGKIEIVKMIFGQEDIRIVSAIVPLPYAKECDFNRL